MVLLVNEDIHFYDLFLLIVWSG